MIERMHPSLTARTRAALAVVCALACVAGSAAGSAHASDAERTAEFLSTWCLDCHDGSSAKGKVNFEGVVARLKQPDCSVEDSHLLRRARMRVADGIMPPADHDQPPVEDRKQALAAFAQVGRVAPERIVPPGTAPRRLNGTEYTNTVRDLFGVDVGDIGALPPDDVGAGFDNVASVLSLSPTTFERMMEIAEGVAQRACPDRDAPVKSTTRIRGKDLRVQEGAGQVSGATAVVWSNGRADRPLDVPRDGVYAISFRAFGVQAGPEPVKCAVVVDGKPVASFDLPATDAAPGERRAEVALRAGTRRIGVAFLNDFYSKGPPVQDRNLAVQHVTLEGPLDAQPDHAWRLQMERATNAAPPAERARAQRAWLVRRVLRRPCTDTDLAMLDAAIGTVAGGPDAHLRAAIVALLVHPEFLFRIEQDPAQGAEVRDLSSHEIATRLSYYMWASTPDAELQAAADSGTLADPVQRSHHVARMLRDPRSSSLAERFAPQWLGIDGIESRMPDVARFPGADAALVQSMRSETVLLFDAVLREDRPLLELLSADYTFVDARLAAHYGVPPPAASGMRRVPAPADRGGGVLAHASVLLSTSNPTRTSPVKRGKWVLESLLDSAPPPPPPGTPALPERPEDRHGLTLRQSLERHRADPACAACHRRMDALGFAFEHYDAVGRLRDRADGAPVDARGELPDGRTVASIADLRAVLLADPAFVRSVAKHLLIYATGRGATAADEAAVDALVERLGPAPTLRAVVVAVAESPAFLRRGRPLEPTASAAVGVRE